ncbi:MAG: cytochrome c [Pelagimonas sp.]|jgi:cytochrome c556|nr:cytochrome c [Pelagimonas sp.]
MRIALIAAVLAAPTFVIADQAQDTVEARQGYYKLLGANMGVFASMAKGAVEYDAAAAQTAADNMSVLTSYNLAPLFAPGTSSEDVDGSRALPAIWSDMAGVQEKGAAFVAAVANMKEVAGQGKAEMAGALGQLGGTCKACHKAYRAK